MARSKPRPMLRHTSRFRGDVAAVLNRLTAEGVIASYKTNIAGQARPERLDVTVEAAGGRTAPELEKQVRDALASLHDEITVTIANKPPVSSKLADDLGGFA